MKNKCRKNEYQQISSLVDDLKLLVSNADSYNGPSHFVTEKANEIFELAIN